MKRPSTTTRSLPNLLLGLWLLLASGFGAGGVLVCHGDDGHLQVGDHGCCPEAPVSGAFWHEADCGDCADARLHAPLPTVAPARTPSLPSPPLLWLPFQRTAADRCVPFAPRPARSAGPPPDPGLSRRVVLQI